MPTKRGDAIARPVVKGTQLDHWQYEATGGARVRYAIDDVGCTQWITDCGTGHPKDTDTPRRRKRG